LGFGSDNILLTGSAPIAMVVPTKSKVLSLSAQISSFLNLLNTPTGPNSPTGTVGYTIPVSLYQLIGNQVSPGSTNTNLLYRVNLTVSTGSAVYLVAGSSSTPLTTPPIVNQGDRLVLVVGSIQNLVVWANGASSPSTWNSVFRTDFELTASIGAGVKMLDVSSCGC
jgi:hypothetical protein